MPPFAYLPYHLSMIVKLATLLAAVGCLGSFSWGRRNFFVRSSEVAGHRNGLAPLGSVFGVLVVVAVALQPQNDQSVVLSLLGIGLFSGALLLFWSAVKAFGRRRPNIAFSCGSPEELVVQGPYR